MTRLKWREDNTGSYHRMSRTKKAEMVINTPVVPRFCRWNFIFMLLFTLLFVALEICSYLLYGFGLGIGYLLGAVAWTAFMTWTFFAALLVCGSALQLYRLDRGHVEKAYVRERSRDEDYKLVPVDNPREKYHVYSKVSLCGVAVFGVLCLIF